MATKKVKKEEPLWLDIACGQRKGMFDQKTGEQDSIGWTGIDVAKTEAADIVHDLNIYPWPFADESVDKARCSHYVEHIPHDIAGYDLDGFILFGNELGRIMKPGGQVEIWTPYYSSRRAFQDPTHRRFICENSFLYFNREWLVGNGLDHYGVTCDFDFAYGYSFSNPRWATANDEARAGALDNYLNVADDIYVTLTKRG